MFIHTVSPILEYSPFFELNYFSKFSFEIGNVVEINLQNKKIRAIVIDKKDLKESKDKTNIRKAGFQLKKIEDENIYGNIENINFQKIKEFAKENLVSIGEVVYRFDGIVKKHLTQSIEKNKIKLIEKSNSQSFEEYLDFIKKEESSFFIFPDDISYKLFKSFLKENLTTKNAKNINVLKISDFIKNFSNCNLENSNIFLHNFDFKKYSTYQKPFINNLELLFLSVKFSFKKLLKSLYDISSGNIKKLFSLLSIKLK
jgi:hypothetical protein